VKVVVVYSQKEVPSTRCEFVT